MTYFVQSNSRITGPLPRRDILAVFAYLNRNGEGRKIGFCAPDAETFLQRLVAAAGMQ